MFTSTFPFHSRCGCVVSGDSGELLSPFLSVGGRVHTSVSYSDVEMSPFNICIQRCPLLANKRFILSKYSDKFYHETTKISLLYRLSAVFHGFLPKHPTHFFISPPTHSHSFFLCLSFCTYMQLLFLCLRKTCKQKRTGTITLLHTQKKIVFIT